MRVFNFDKVIITACKHITNLDIFILASLILMAAKLAQQTWPVPGHMHVFTLF